MTKSFCDACGSEVATEDYRSPCMTIAYPRVTAHRILCGTCAEPIAKLLKEMGVIEDVPVINADK